MRGERRTGNGRARRCCECAFQFLRHEMKKLCKITALHAERRRDVLENHWRETDLKEGEARQIIDRINTVLAQLPVAMKQAHERIIGERQVKNDEKILSLYEDHASVYVRGKAGAEVELMRSQLLRHGSQLLLGECQSGVIDALSSSCASRLGVGGRQSSSGHEDVAAQFGSDEGDGRRSIH